MNKKKDHYDQSYFKSRYRGIIDDPGYYTVLAAYWATAICHPLAGSGFSAKAKILDYGCGTGVVSAAFPNAACFDIAPYVCSFLRLNGRAVFERTEEIPLAHFEGILCSHSLEHHENPKQTLELLRQYVHESGFLILLLPIERDFTPQMTPDLDQHLYGWTFQSISNLLRVSGWRPLIATSVYGPFFLRTLARVLPIQTAVALAHAFGRIKRGFPSMLLLAQCNPL